MEPVGLWSCREAWSQVRCEQPPWPPAGPRAGVPHQARERAGFLRRGLGAAAQRPPEPPLSPFSRQLCLLLNAENIFHSMADILLREEDLKFASTMVHTLNTILLTSTELFQLRNQLKDLKSPVLLAHGLQPGAISVPTGAALPAHPSLPGGWRGGDENVT